MNFSVIPTLRLKFVSSLGFSLQVMNSSICGWSTFRIAMFAPRLVPPCFTASVAELKTLRKVIGPLETPLVLLTRAFT